MAELFVPRPWQRPIIDFGTRLDRCNIFARPGMGKTSAMLAILDALTLTGSPLPALVIGPLRVANSVWDGEVQRWAQFNRLRVSKVLGSSTERAAALRRPADLYTIHYGLLDWLAQQFDGKPWPFRTVVADESSRLKRQRCSYQQHPESGKVYLRTGGAKNAAAISRYAKRTPHWYNLTGTPASNGLQNLWGQQWFIDFGQALGRSYDAFTQRWFYQRRGTSREQAVFEPFPHAHDEITERIKPTTISLDPRDWFELQEPRIVCLYDDLPPALRKQYNKLHREACLTLNEDTEVTAANAGVVTSKCLQFAAGNIYDEQQQTHHLHDLKLDMLESLVENMSGTPLLVAYKFKSDLAMLKARFKQAVELPSGPKQKQVEADWNAGKIEMLLVQPASAGHGLNLQHGGCDICIFSPDWDLELYEQVIERLGPMRQKQAGYDRVVSIYQLLIRNTFDEVVAARLESKASVQEAVMQATRIQL